jgi:hypothetical protein
MHIPRNEPRLKSGRSDDPPSHRLRPDKSAFAEASAFAGLRPDKSARQAFSISLPVPIHKCLLDGWAQASMSDSETVDFAPRQGRTRVCGEAYFSYAAAGNSRRTTYRGKRCRLWMDTP